MPPKTKTNDPIASLRGIDQAQQAGGFESNQPTDKNSTKPTDVKEQPKRTINEDLEGELIVTVVATGFDATYFAKRTGQSLSIPESTNSKQDESDVTDLNMDLGSANNASEAAHDFNSDAPIPNIWSLDHDNLDSAETSDTPDVGIEEAELEKPSFLRRLKKRRSERENDQTTDKDNR